jgi:hypothetical protein
MENNIQQQQNENSASQAPEEQAPAAENREEKIVKTYDTQGFLIGAVAGLPLAFISFIDVLMASLIGMFVGLIIGANIKRK